MSVRLLQEVQKVAKKLHSVGSVMHISHIIGLIKVGVVIIISNMSLLQLQPSGSVIINVIQHSLRDIT